MSPEVGGQIRYRSDHTSPGRRPHSIQGNVTFLAAFQPNTAARPAQFSSPVKKLLQSLKNWRHRYGGPTTPSGTIPAPCNPQLLSSAQTGSQMLSPRAAWNWLGTRGHPVTVWLSR